MCCQRCPPQQHPFIIVVKQTAPLSWQLLGHIFFYGRMMNHAMHDKRGERRGVMSVAVYFNDTIGMLALTDLVLGSHGTVCRPKSEPRCGLKVHIQLVLGYLTLPLEVPQSHWDLHSSRCFWTFTDSYWSPKPDTFLQTFWDEEENVFNLLLILIWTLYGTVTRKHNFFQGCFKQVCFMIALIFMIKVSWAEIPLRKNCLNSCTVCWQTNVNQNWILNWRLCTVGCDVRELVIIPSNSIRWDVISVQAMYKMYSWSRKFTYT